MTFVAVGAPAGAAVRKGLGYNSGIVMGRQYYLGEYHIRPYDWPWGNTRVWCIDVDNDIPLDDAVTYTVVNDIPDLSKLHEDALSWITVRDDITDRVSSAAVKLVAHDFMGKPYPGGILNVDTLTAADIGYNVSNGDASVMNDRDAIIARARQLKAYGLAQASTYPLPLAITQAGFTQPEPGVEGISYWSVNAANGRGVPGVYLLLNAENSSPASQVSFGWSTSTTGADGVAELRFTPLAPGGLRITVTGLWAGAATFLIPQGLATQRGLGVSLAAGSAEFSYTSTTPTTTTVPTTTAPTTTTRPATTTSTTLIPSPTTTRPTTTTTRPTTTTTRPPTTTRPTTTTSTTLIPSPTTTRPTTTTTTRPSPTPTTTTSTTRPRPTTTTTRPPTTTTTLIPTPTTTTSTTRPRPTTTTTRPATTTTRPPTTTTTLIPTPTTTTTTTRPPTTTTRPPTTTTSTTRPATTTTRPPTTTTTLIPTPTTTTVPTTTSTSTTVPPSTTSTTVVPSPTTTTTVIDSTTTTTSIAQASTTTTLPVSVKGQQLARTGSSAWAFIASALMAIGAGAIVLGGLNVADRRRNVHR